MPADNSGGRRQGVLADWNDDRGFGFITPDAGGPRSFVHVSAFPRGQRPVAGCALTYAEARDERNRLRASDVRYVGRTRSRRKGGAGVPVALAISASFFAVLLGLMALDEVSGWLVAGYGFMSALAFLNYRMDKTAAREGRWRTSESTLHLIAVLGGWPGALIARPVLRHKTTKQPFRTVFWMTVVANCAALAWFVWAAPLALP